MVCCVRRLVFGSIFVEAYRDISSKESFLVFCAQEEGLDEGELREFGEELMKVYM